MKTLTAKEEEIMGFFWEKGPMFVKQLVELYEEPRPHFNTLSTIVRGLEDKGYLSHKEEDISVEELKELIRQVEEGQNEKTQ